MIMIAICQKKKILFRKLVIKGVFFLYSSRAIESLYHLDVLNLCQIGDVRLLPSMTNILKEKSLSNLRYLFFEITNCLNVWE